MIKTNEEKLQRMLADDARKQRDVLLTDCDWTMVPDAPTDKEAWTQYRQALRDLTVQVGFPTKIKWPATPAA